MLTPARRDDGSLTLLVIGYVTIAAVLIVAGIDASKVFLAHRALSAAADAAALDAAQAVDKAAVYAGTAGGCGNLLPLDETAAAQRAQDAVGEQLPGLRQTFASLDDPQTQVVDGTVTVNLSGSIALPFGRVLALLVPGHADGRVHIDASAHAQSPLTSPGGC
jgi:uncharacterized membrane protein